MQKGLPNGGRLGRAHKEAMFQGPLNQQYVPGSRQTVRWVGGLASAQVEDWCSPGGSPGDTRHIGGTLSGNMD